MCVEMGMRIACWFMSLIGGAFLACSFCCRIGDDDSVPGWFRWLPFVMLSMGVAMEDSIKYNAPFFVGLIMVAEVVADVVHLIKKRRSARSFWAIALQIVASVAMLVIGVTRYQEVPSISTLLINFLWLIAGVAHYVSTIIMRRAITSQWTITVIAVEEPEEQEE